MITEKTLVETRDDLAIAELGDEAVILDGDRSHYYGLNQVGLRVLQLSKERRSVHEIIERVQEEYDVEREKLKEDVLSFLHEMAELDLVITQSDRAREA